VTAGTREAVIRRRRSQYICWWFWVLLNNVYSLPALSPAGGQAGADRYSYEQRLAEGLDQGSKDRAFARPRQAELAALATDTTGDAGHVGVQPGLKLKEVKMLPRAAQAVMDGLSGSAAGRTGYGFSSAPSLAGC
jgi:hypothetical protein